MGKSRAGYFLFRTTHTLTLVSGLTYVQAAIVVQEKMSASDFVLRKLLLYGIILGIIIIWYVIFKRK